MPRAVRPCGHWVSWQDGRTVRTLFLLRHAKSSWKDPSLSDQDRPLAPRGRRDAKRMARYANSQGVRPELVLCSSARRARATLEELLPALGPDAAVCIDDDLYGAEVADLLARLRGIGAPVKSVLVVGHNPGLQDLAIRLAGDGEPLAMEQLTAKFPTGALAVLDLGAAAWAGLAPGCAYLVRVVVPRELPVERDDA